MGGQLRPRRRRGAPARPGVRPGGRALGRPHPARDGRRDGAGTLQHPDPHRPHAREHHRRRAGLRGRPAHRRRRGVRRLFGVGRRAADGDLGAADGAGDRRGGDAVPRDDQPEGGDRRRPRDGLAGGGGAEGPGDDAVPPDDALRRRVGPRARDRGRPRRGGAPDRQERGALHARRPPRRRAGPAGRGGAGDRRAHPRDGVHARLPRRPPPRRKAVPRAVPRPDADVRAVRAGPDGRADPGPPLGPLLHRRRERGPRRPGERAGAVRGRRVQLQRPARGEPTGEQQPPGGPRLRLPRRPGRGRSRRGRREGGSRSRRSCGTTSRPRRARSWTSPTSGAACGA